MIGVMFRFDSKITTEDGHPLTKVFMFGKEFSKPIGVKVQGIRPNMAYVFRVQGTEGGLESVESKALLMEWLHKSISYALHPVDGKIVYQNKAVSNLFKLT